MDNQEQTVNNDLICPACNKKYRPGETEGLPQRTFVDGAGAKSVKLKCHCGYFLQKMIVPLPDKEDVEDPKVREYLENLAKIH